MEFKMIINKTTICIILIVLLLGLMGGFIIGQNINPHSNNSIVTKSDVVGTYKGERWGTYSPAILVLKKDGTCFFPSEGIATWKQENDVVIITLTYEFGNNSNNTTYRFFIVDGGLYSEGKQLFERVN